MIDLHSHILPGIDDGARNVSEALEMARVYVEQGVEIVACTPHILPGLYNNSGPQIRRAVSKFQNTLDESGIQLRLTVGSDNHIGDDFVSNMCNGHLLALGDTRYILVEPPHHVAPVRLEELFFDILLAKHIPILTHPERLTWIEAKYCVIERLARRGVWMQITSGSLRGRFGRRARYWAERMLSEGLVHILASDAHDNAHRSPDLLKGRVAAAKLIGEAEAECLVATRPRDVLCNKLPGDCVSPQKSAFVFRRRGYFRDVEGDHYSRGRDLAQRVRRFFT